MKYYKLNHEHSTFTDVVGKKALLITPLAPGQIGQARWSGTIMNAKLDASVKDIITQDTEVLITAVEGNVLIVK